MPQAPEIRLHMADDATEPWQRTEVDLDATGLPPPFWASAWAGGQALARYILDNPETVRGARVLDFASGSGLVAIAAAGGGAAAVTANDIDAFARDPIALNAAANGVEIGVSGENLAGRADGWDVILAADIFYERDTAVAVTDWLARRVAEGARVLVGDPGRSYFDEPQCDRLASYDVPVMRSLEEANHKRSSVWRFKAEPGASPETKPGMPRIAAVATGFDSACYAPAPTEGLRSATHCAIENSQRFRCMPFLGVSSLDLGRPSGRPLFLSTARTTAAHVPRRRRPRVPPFELHYFIILITALQAARRRFHEILGISSQSDVIVPPD